MAAAPARDTAWEAVVPILRCPATGQPLAIRDRQPLEIHPRWLEIGERFRLGMPPRVLATADGTAAYPLWSPVAGLLPELGLAAEGSGRALPATHAFEGERLQNTRFYDEFGWVEHDSGAFNDALAFEDMRPLTEFYRRPCYRRVDRHLTGGRYLLDCASGAVQIPDYVGHSRRFDKRLCVDLSFAGLLQAKRRLGEHAVCIAGDITALPFAEGSVDNFISLHTIYHVPAAEQPKAVAELWRALKPGGRGVVVYSWGVASPVYRFGEWLRRTLEARGWLPKPPPGPKLETNLGLYFHAFDYRWYRDEIRPRYRTRLRVWRSLDKGFMESFARGRVSAWLTLGPVFVLEELFPWFFGRYGLIPMFVFAKPAAAASPSPILPS